MYHLKRSAVLVIALASITYLPAKASAEEEFSAAAVGSYEEPGYSSGRDYTLDSQADSVDPFTGTLKVSVTDLHLPGNGGLDISIVRSYQSIINNVGPYSSGYTARTPYGAGWDIHFGRILLSSKQAFISNNSDPSGCKIGQISSQMNPILELPGGGRDILANADGSDYAFITKGRWIGKCLPSGANSQQGGLLVVSPDGVEYLFNVKSQVALQPSSGAYFVSQITDPDGNYLKFTYGSSSGFFNVLKKITSSDGRTVNFEYADEQGPLALLASISGEGKKITYTYENAAYDVGPRSQYLTRVRYPDGSDWTYKYNDVQSPAGESPGRYSMASMISPLGLKTSYDYALKQMGVDPAEKMSVITKRTQASASGVVGGDLVWKYLYTKGYAPNNDSTQVDGPSQCVRYEHVGPNTISNDVTGANRGLWRIGLLMKTEIRSLGCGTLLRAETNEWGSQNVSSHNEMRKYSRLVEDYTRAPVLEKKVITQDGATYITETDYDEYGFPTSIEEDGQKDRVTSVSYIRPAGKWILGKIFEKEISGIPGRVSYTYNNSGRVKKEDMYGVVTEYAYTAEGDTEKVTDANGYSTHYSDYHRGIPRKTIFPDGDTIERVVTSRGMVSSQKDLSGRQTIYTYDSMDRLESIIPPKGPDAKTSISYSTDAGLTETLERSGYQRVRKYNQLGQLIRQSELGGDVSIVQAAKYHPNGQRAFLSYPSYGAPSEYGESSDTDGLGRITKISHGDGTFVTFNHQNGSVAVRDEKNQLTTKQHISFGNPDEIVSIGTIQPGGIETLVNVDNLGRVRSVSQGGLTRHYSFNAKGFLESETHPETGLTIYTHDAVGNVISKKVGETAADQYVYDSRNRVTEISYGGSDLSLINTYDIFGLLRSQKFSGTLLSYEYDEHDKLVSETLALNSASKIITVRYGYDALDRLISQTYPSGQVVEYAPDAFGKATKASPYVSEISYHPNGLVSYMRYGNGRTITTQQDPQRLRTVERIASGLEHPLHLSYQYDGIGNLTKISNLADGAGYKDMEYDELNRLYSATGGRWDGAQFRYNDKGDFTSALISGRTQNYEYDDQGRLSTVGDTIDTWQFSYDGKGSVLRGRGQYTYDLAGNLISLCADPVLSCSNSPDQIFEYDGRGRKVSRLTNGDNPEQVLSFYGHQDQLLWEENLLDDSWQEFIYVAGERVADRMDCKGVDSDMDGMPNCYERRMGLTWSDSSDASADADMDELNNYDEFIAGTSPIKADTDFDGMPDGWEHRYGLDPLDAGDAAMDKDGDGISNLDEYFAGSDPTRNERRRPIVAPVIDLLLN